MNVSHMENDLICTSKLTMLLMNNILMNKDKCSKQYLDEQCTWPYYRDTLDEWYQHYGRINSRRSH